MRDTPVSFFLDTDDKDIASLRALDPDAEPHRLVLGEHYWVALTWMRLRDAGVPATLDNRVRDDGIVLFYAGDKRPVWDAARRGSRALLVAIRSDRNPVGFADFEIVQNAASADGRRALHLPHWPQPGLVPRDPARGAALRTVLFPGTPQNLHPGFTGERWQAFVRERGLEFRCHFDRAGDAPPRWQDYRDVDLMLALRPSGATEVRNKPAWKLFNAWLAGVPALLGPESGYRELREGPLDFIEIADERDAIAAIARLLDAPDTYRAMVEHGLRRGAAYTDAATLARWRRLVDAVLRPAAARPAALPLRRWREAAARATRLWNSRR